MIRHIVTWKLRAQEATAHAESVATIARVLEPLVSVVPGIHRLVVLPNAAEIDRNWDVVLIGDYESLECLEAYRVHPDHVAAAVIVGQYVSERAAIDVEI
ncbi:MAG: Dabb family protein [Rhodoglobus sp.]